MLGGSAAGAAAQHFLQSLLRLQDPALHQQQLVGLLDV